jgi:stearoyl-CoA desaturase (delta-9 desaturase)
MTEPPTVRPAPDSRTQVARPAAASEPSGSLLRSFAAWFDTWARSEQRQDDRDPDRVEWMRVLPFVGMHVACLAVFVVGWSWVALGVAVALYFLRMFAITGFYHRYFSHRSFRTSRAGQFAFALCGAAAVQRGPLWWAAHHRHHHKNSDLPADVHSPRQSGFFRSHVGWFLTPRNFHTRVDRVQDLARFPELRFLDRFDMLVPVLLAVVLFLLGLALETWAPGLGTDRWQMLVWGFFVSTVVLAHATFTINSLSHVIGTQPYDTKDDSRNNLFLALLTMGEGWHNNHHYFQGSVRQGFRWWQVDLTYYGLVVLSWLGVVWDLRPVPSHVIAEADR